LLIKRYPLSAKLMVSHYVLSVLGICCGSCFISELKSQYEKFESDPLIYASARSCDFTLRPEAVILLV